MNLNSRHRLGVRRRVERVEVVSLISLISLGGNGRRMVDESFGQECRKQFSVEPGLCTLGIVLGQMTELGDGHEVLEDQRDRPSNPIPFSDTIPGPVPAEISMPGTS